MTTQPSRKSQVRVLAPYLRGGFGAGAFVWPHVVLAALASRTVSRPVKLSLTRPQMFTSHFGLPWSSRALPKCYRVGANRFGWSHRNPEPGSMREGRWLVGYGMAGISYPWHQAPCQARATVYQDGTAYVRAAATDLGTGTYPVMGQLSAELLGLELDRVRFDLGDSAMPEAPPSGGSGLAVALSTALHHTCDQVIRAFLDLVKEDEDSPPRGSRRADVLVSGGRIQWADDPAQGERYTDILLRHGLDEVTVDGASEPAQPENVCMAPAGSFGAKFVEIRVDAELGQLRICRVVSVIDAGQVLNKKLATSQIMGGTVGGIGMALFEDTVADPTTGRVANATLADYLVPVNADIPDMEVVFVGEADKYNPIGVKGIGEIGMTAIPPAIANAVYHATGKRIRSLPITIEQLLR